MKIGVLCSGGDAPGMNPCLRAVVRSGIASGHEIVGILRGYSGLLNEDFYHCERGYPRMTLRSVSNLSRHGGTILRSSRCPEFETEEGVEKAAGILVNHEFGALIVIGGNGSYRGAIDLTKKWKGHVIGCPGTIDNDLLGTDFTIGFSTATTTAVKALDQLRDTAESHQMCFLVEVMGRHNGNLALYSALAGGAEIAMIPEHPLSVEKIVAHLEDLKIKGKKSIMFVVSEGGKYKVPDLKKDLDAAGCPFSTRTIQLGHVQRGGDPTPEDRILGTRLGAFAIELIDKRISGVGTGVIRNEPVATPLEDCVKDHHEVPEELINLLRTMSS